MPSLDRRPFATGSRVYGSPEEEADLDVVMLLDRSTYWLLTDFATKHVNPNNHPSASDEEGHPSFFLGKVNIIPVFEPEIYDAWLKACQLCKAKKPVTRREAIKIHEACKAEGQDAVKRRKGIK